MTHYRTEYRAALLAALQVDPVFADFTTLSAWVRDIDAQTLPVLAVATPREVKDRDALETSQRDTTVMVVVKIKGGDDLEQVLDDLSMRVEQLAIPALETAARPCFLTDTEVVVDGGGERRVGTLTMKFLVTAWLAEPLSDP